MLVLSAVPRVLDTSRCANVEDTVQLRTELMRQGLDEVMMKVVIFRAGDRRAGSGRLCNREVLLNDRAPYQKIDSLSKGVRRTFRPSDSTLS